MWTRKELKEQGKAAFKANYWRCVLAALILALITGGLAGYNGYHSGYQISQGQQQSQTQGQNQTQGQSQNLADQLPAEIEGMTQEERDKLAQDLDELSHAIDTMPESDKQILAGTIIAVIAGAVAIVSAISFVLTILVFNPLKVGCQRFFTENSKAAADLHELGFGFGRGGYGRVVKTMLIMNIFLLLWSLLFLIPGIIKSYSYRMVPYILAQEPELSGREAINRSREMMNGHKWNTFVLDLSFILWILLTVITLGLVGVFYLNPYYYATNAELYNALSGKNGGSVKYDPELV